MAYQYGKSLCQTKNTAWKGSSKVGFPPSHGGWGMEGRPASTMVERSFSTQAISRLRSRNSGRVETIHVELDRVFGEDSE